MSRETLAVVVDQMAPLRCLVEENGRRVAETVAGARGADLVVFPELALTGYLVGDRALELALELGQDPLPMELPDSGPALALGYVGRGPDALCYNEAAVLRGRDVLARHRKTYLPTYGMFDEGRVFAPGRAAPPTFELEGWKVGLLVCEELWHPALPYLLALQGAEVILVLAAAAGRGRPRDEGSGPLFASTGPWELLARAAAFNHGLWLVLANRAGVEAGLSFAGGSLVIAPDGEVVARADQAREVTMEVTLDREAIQEARHPFSHLRDENPAMVLRELRRITGLG